MLVDREHTIAYRAAREKYINTPGQLIHEPSLASRGVSHTTDNSQHAETDNCALEFTEQVHVTERARGTRLRVSSTASTPQPSARSVARGPAPTRQTWGGVEHANCRHTPVESRRQRTSGFSSEPAAAGLPPLSPVSPRGGARRAVREGQPRAIGAGFGRGGRP